MSIEIPVNERRPAPFLVCTYTFGDGALPTVRAAADIDQAAKLAEEAARASCQPVVRVYVFDETGRCRPVMTVRA
jgi:hypothetical protein